MPDKWYFIVGEFQSHCIFHVNKKTPVVELSILVAGTRFDIELTIAWML